jgi:hypothetical protein
MATDVAGDGLFLYGGQDSADCGDELWHFDWRSPPNGDPGWKVVAPELGNAPRSAFAGMTVDPRTGDPWVFSLCGIASCNWYYARFDQQLVSWSGAFAPQVPGALQSAAHYDSRLGAILVRGGGGPRGCFDVPDRTLPVPGIDSTSLKPHSMWAFDPSDRTWSGLGSIAGSPAPQRFALSDYDPASDLYLQYGGAQAEGGLASDSLWAFDLSSEKWNLLGHARPRYGAAGAYCACTGDLFVAAGGDSALAAGGNGLSSDAYFIRIEKPAQFSWDGAATERNAPWRWGTLTLEQDGEIVPGSVRLMNCAAAKDLQVADDIKPIGRDRWHVRFRTGGTEEEQALAAGHLVLTGRVQGQPVNFLARLSAQKPGTMRPSAALRCDQVAGGWRIQYTGDHAEQVRVFVYDVAGRVLAELAVPTNSLVWDGRDAGGRQLANGIYFLRVSGGGSRDATKVVLIR